VGIKSHVTVAEEDTPKVLLGNKPLLQVRVCHPRQVQPPKHVCGRLHSEPNTTIIWH
jgi:hypothetical protein